MLVFDFDGVIADSLSHYQAACLHAIKTLKLPVAETSQNFSQLENVNYESLARTLGADVQQLATIVTEHIVSQPDQPLIYSGIAKAIKQSATLDSLHILSAGASVIAQNILHSNQLEHYFDTINGGDTPGSKAQKLAMMAERFKQPPKSIIMIGDSISDIRAAREFGCREIAVSWGWHSRESLEKLEPEFIAHTPEQLTQIIEAMY